MFKIGSKVVLTGVNIYRPFQGKHGVIQNYNGLQLHRHIWSVVLEGDRYPYNIYQDDMELVAESEYVVYRPNANTSSSVSTKPNFMSTLIQKIKLARIDEPNKTLVKAGILDSDQNLTGDGREAFGEFLFRKFGSDFAADVAPILKEQLDEDSKK